MNMKMINYDFYDLHAVIVCIRTKPENKTIIPILNELYSRLKRFSQKLISCFHIENN